MYALTNGCSFCSFFYVSHFTYTYTWGIHQRHGGLRTGYVGTSLILYLHFFTLFPAFKPSKFDLILGFLLLKSELLFPFTEQLGTYSITNTLVGGRNTWISDTDPGFVITWCGEWCLSSKFCTPFLNIYTVKEKVSVPYPAGMSLKPNSPWAGILHLCPARESLVSDIPFGDGKNYNLFTV